jgi:hypothetical protein
MVKYITFFILIITGFSCTKEKLNAKFFEAKPQEGFNFPYYLFIPENVNSSDSLYLIVEPNNSGFVDDDFDKHIEKARRTASLGFYMGNYVARELNYPLLVPVFPRSRSHWQIYTHALDRDAMLQHGNKLERIDLQLLAMVKDAQKKLEAEGSHLKKQVLLTGFSASGTFANRFTLLHPDKVKAVAAGGLNGLLMLPVDTINKQPLHYPIGTADYDSLMQKPFNYMAFKNTPQLLFMGELDNNDAILYDDGYSLHERNLIFKTMGETMMPDRWEYCKKNYKTHEINAIVKTFNNIGHEQPEKIKKEVLAFFKTALVRE